MPLVYVFAKAKQKQWLLKTNSGKVLSVYEKRTVRKIMIKRNCNLNIWYILEYFLLHLYQHLNINKDIVKGGCDNLKIKGMFSFSV